MNIYKRKGISLIVLVITIIVIGILAGAVILSIAKGSPINDATKAVFLSDVSGFKDELNMYIGQQYLDTLGVFNPAKLNADEDDIMYDGLVDTSKTIDDIIPSMKEADKYLGDFAIIDGILVFKGYEDNKQEWAKNSGMEVISAVFYSGNIEIYKVRETAKYKLEVWGGEGGSFSKKKGGLGGYACGEIDLTAGQVLYINVGGMGNSGGTYAQSYLELPPAGSGLGGYNGGGNGGIYFSDWATGEFRVGSGGGGATDVRINGTDLINRIIIAGGGGGAGTFASGGSGGGDNGVDGSDAINETTHATGGLGGTQTAGGNGGILLVLSDTMDLVEH